ncbi:hypothetical protein [Pedococcus cremeus]|uniref:hypothetical protein n=1 Tax=Pedococcus cremeus TaxID=587636 RepID=UPI001FDFCEC3|nr:hypothetical protein [Pedococcus cremeus]
MVTDTPASTRGEACAAPAVQPDRDRVWRRQLVFWHGIAGVIFAVALYLTAVDDRGPRVASAACVVVIALAYAVFGARGLHSHSMRWGAVYLAIAWPAFLAIVALNPQGDYYFLSFALFPQTWALLNRRVATWTTVGVIAALTVVRLATLPPSTSTLAAVLISSAIGLALCSAWGCSSTCSSRRWSGGPTRSRCCTARRPTSPLQSGRRASSPSASGSPARSTTPWPRASPRW